MWWKSVPLTARLLTFCQLNTNLTFTSNLNEHSAFSSWGLLFVLYILSLTFFSLPPYFIEFCKKIQLRHQTIIENTKIICVSMHVYIHLRLTVYNRFDTHKIILLQKFSLVYLIYQQDNVQLHWSFTRNGKIVSPNVAECQFSSVVSHFIQLQNKKCRDPDQQRTMRKHWTAQHTL